MIRSVEVLCLIIVFSLVHIHAAANFNTIEAIRDKNSGGTIKGIVVESVSQQPLEYVNIAVFLHEKGNEEVITGTISDEDGTFKIENLPLDTFNVRFSFVGFKPKFVEKISLGDSETIVDMGQVEIDPGDEMIEAVEIRGERKLLSLDMDKNVFIVTRDMTSTGGSALDIMESIPSVSVDYEGEVNLRGSSNVTILIDGRPSHLESLDQMPATMIDRVEVITSPSARYDPDGTSGIINIIMKKEQQFGAGGMVNLNIGTGDKYNGSLHLNNRIERFNIFGNYDFRIHSMEGYNVTDRMHITTEGDTVRQLHQYENFYRDGTFHNFRLGTDFFLDPQNTITLMGRFNLRDTRPRNYSKVNLFRPSETEMSTSMERQFDGLGQEYVLNYTREFDQEGREFMADLMAGISSGETKRDIIVEPNNYNKEEKKIKYAESSAPGTLISVQSDYVHPFGDRSRFEVGIKSIIRDVEDDFRMYNEDPESGDLSLNNDYSNYFLYNETIHSAYIIYAFSAGDLHLQGGLRAEQHDSQGELRESDDEEDFSRSFFEPFPSAHLKYLLDEKNSLSFSYSRRINRPGISLLNPFVNYSDPMNISFGNPKLKPEFINSYELGYQFSQNRKELSTSLFYRQTDDIISREMTLTGGEDPQTITTFENLQQGVSTGIEIVGNYPVTSWWRINGNITYFYKYLEDERLPDWDYEDDVWQFQLTSNWEILERFDMQARFHYNSAEITAGRTRGGGCQQHGGQGVIDENYYLDLGLRTDVLEGNGTISLRLSDVFKTRTFDMYTYGDTFTSDLKRRRESRVLYLGFTYRLDDYRERQDIEREDSLLDEIE